MTQSGALIQRETEVRQQFDIRLNRKLRNRHLLMVGAAVVGLAIVSPIVIAAAEAGAALVALGGLAIVGAVGWRMVPRIMLTVDNREREKMQQEMNRHLAALKEEARQNPIEQAEQEYLRRNEQFEQFKAAMAQIGGKMQNYKSRLDETKRTKPNYNLDDQYTALKRMQDFYQTRMRMLEAAARALIEFRNKLEEARTKWDLQLTANDAIRAMNATDRDARIHEILTDVAFSEVQQQFDQVFATLDVEAAEMRGKNALEFGGGASIEIPVFGTVAATSQV